MKPLGQWHGGTAVRAFSSRRAPLWFTNQICVALRTQIGETIHFWFLGPIRPPHPHFSSLVSHPDQPEFTPVQDEQEAMDLWSSSIWWAQEMSEEQWQALFRSFNLQDVVTWMYATLQGEAGLVSSADISSMGNVNCCFKKLCFETSPFLRHSCSLVSLLF